MMENNDVEIFTKEEKTHEFLKKKIFIKSFIIIKELKRFGFFLNSPKKKGKIVIIYMKI